MMLVAALGFSGSPSAIAAWRRTSVALANAAPVQAEQTLTLQERSEGPCPIDGKRDMPPDASFLVAQPVEGSQVVAGSVTSQKWEWVGPKLLPPAGYTFRDMDQPKIAGVVFAGESAPDHIQPQWRTNDALSPAEWEVLRAKVEKLFWLEGNLTKGESDSAAPPDEDPSQSQYGGEEFPCYGVDFLPRVASMDLDVDSDNDDNPRKMPERDAHEDEIEEDDPGKYLPVNRDDDNGNLEENENAGEPNEEDGVPDFADGFDLDGSSAGDPEKRDDAPGSNEKFTPVVLEIPEWVDVNVAQVSLAYSASDPLGVTAAGTYPDQSWTAPGGSARLWMLDGSSARKKRPINDPSDPGHYVPPASYPAKLLGFSKDSTTGKMTATLYLEGIHPSAGEGKDVIQATLDWDGDGPASTSEDKVAATILAPDLRVDGDNKLGFGTPTADPVVDAHEFFGPDKDSDAVKPDKQVRPGKMLAVNDGDEDDNGKGDGIPGWADWAEPAASDKFVPVVLELPQPMGGE